MPRFSFFFDRASMAQTRGILFIYTPCTIFLANFCAKFYLTFFPKSLDKLRKVWYNINVKRTKERINNDKPYKRNY